MNENLFVPDYYILNSLYVILVSLSADHKIYKFFQNSLLRKIKFLFKITWKSTLQAIAVESRLYWFEYLSRSNSEFIAYLENKRLGFIFSKEMKGKILMYTNWISRNLNLIIYFAMIPWSLLIEHFSRIFYQFYDLSWINIVWNSSKCFIQKGSIPTLIMKHKKKAIKINAYFLRRI